MAVAAAVVAALRADHQSPLERLLGTLKVGWSWAVKQSSLWCDCLVLGRPQSLQSRLREDPGHFGKQARAMPLYISGRGYEEISCLVPFKLLMIIGAQPDLDALLFPALHEEVKFPCQGQPTSWSPMYASCVAFIEKLYWGVAEPLPHELLVTGTKWVSKNLRVLE